MTIAGGGGLRPISSWPRGEEPSPSLALQDALPVLMEVLRQGQPAPGTAGRRSRQGIPHGMAFCPMGIGASGLEEGSLERPEAWRCGKPGMPSGQNAPKGEQETGLKSGEKPIGTESAKDHEDYT